MAVVKNLMVRAGADFSAITKQANRAKASMNGMQASVSKSCSRMTVAVTSMNKVFATLGATISVAAVIAAGKAAKAAYDTQTEASAKQAQVKRNTMGARSSEIKSIEDLIDAQERLGVDKGAVQTEAAQELGTYLCPGDFGDRRGKYTPSSWPNGRTQYGLLKTFSITDSGGYIDKDLVNPNISIADLHLEHAPYISLKIQIKDDAKHIGGINLFGEKYGDTVRVVQMGDFSSELCGGTHVKNTSNISAFKIVSESGVAAGVRRIEALTGAGLIAHFNQVEETLKEAAALLKVSPADVVKRITALQEEVKTLSKENDKLKAKIAKAAAGDVTSEAEDVNGIKVLVKALSGVDMNGMRDLGDEAKQKLGEAVILYATENDGKVNLMATATEGAIKKGAHAGNLIKEVASLVGGGGGGRPNMAQAGGKNPAGIPDALKKAKEVIISQIG